MSRVGTLPWPHAFHFVSLNVERKINGSKYLTSLCMLSFSLALIGIWRRLGVRVTREISFLSRIVSDIRDRIR